MTILLIGSGRLATHLKHWNSVLNQPNQLLTWNRSEDLSALQDHLKKSSLVWLAISDSSLTNFYEDHLVNLSYPVVHFSGALHDSRMLCAHPLMSFPSEFLPNTVYSQIYFALTGCELLSKALPGFNNKFFLLDAVNKSLYHSLCVISGNFPQLLWLETLKNFKKLNVPSEAVDIYIKQITENFINLKEKALTGPFVRKDEKTIESNLSALKENSKLYSIYQTFFKEFYL